MSIHLAQHYPNGQYVGHDEPSVEFKSNLPGSGNNMTYTTVLPRDPKVQRTRRAGGTTWNFELRPTFWFGITLCDSQSAPEFTTKCTPDSDSNNLVGSNPNAPNYIGKHPGNAYMELQFYGPGYVPVRGIRLHGNSVLRCHDHRQLRVEPEHRRR